MKSVNKEQKYNAHFIASTKQKTNIAHGTNEIPTPDKVILQTKINMGK